MVEPGLCSDCGVRREEVEDGLAPQICEGRNASDEKIIVLKQPSGLVGDGIAFEPNVILEGAKDNYLQVVVAGFNKDGEIDLRGSHGSRDILWVLQRAILHLMLDSE